MKIWRMELATDMSGGNMIDLYGLAKNAKEAVKKALQTDAGKQYKDEGVYFSKIVEIGEVDF